MTPEPREWDAAGYDALAEPQSRWGLRILERLELRGDETVLEAGCGTGRDTERLLSRLPHGRVIAVDGSARMLEELRRRLPGRLDRVEVRLADLARPLELRSRMDAVFSVATFHWIEDHESLFRNLASVLKPGGRLAADFGGRGNIAEVSAAVEEVTGVPGEEGIWNFAGPDETCSRLQAAGFAQVEVQLHTEPVRFEDQRRLRAFLQTVVLGSHLARLDPSEHQHFVQAVADRLPDATVRYVRLTVDGRMPHDTS